MREMLRSITQCCREKGCRPPSRATVYNLLPTLPGPSYLAGNLPGAVREALYNLDAGSVVPGRQVAFYCFNYGDLRAMSFAAGMPWLAIYQALRMPGYRKKSHGLVEAAAKVRRI